MDIAFSAAAAFFVWKFVRRRRQNQQERIAHPAVRDDAGREVVVREGAVRAVAVDEEIVPDVVAQNRQAVMMDLRQATITGNVLIAHHCNVNQYAQVPEAEQNAEDKTFVSGLEKRRLSQWEMIDGLENSLDVSDCERLMQFLPGLTEESNAAIANTSLEHRPVVLLALLRWHWDFQPKVSAEIRAMASTWIRTADRHLQHISVVIFETCLRLAIRQLDQLNRLPASTFAALRDVDCLSQHEHYLVKKGKQTLSSLLLNRHSHELLRLCALLLHRHPDIHAALSTAFLRSPLSTIGHFHHNVPAPPEPCVPRDGLEVPVRRWMLSRAHAEPVSSLLLLYGLGGGGKSCLAARAALEALTCGFHRVVWLDVMCGRMEMMRVVARHLSVPKDVILSDSMEILRGELKERMEELQKAGERLLLVIDDAVDDDDWALMPHFDAVLVTSRVQTIGGDVEGTQSLKVEGLSPTETIDLLSRVLKPETCDALQARPGMWKALQEVCAGGFHMPLTVKIVGGLVQRELEVWRERGMEYLKELEERLVALRGELKKKRIRPHCGQFFEHQNVYAAIYLSVERLSAEDRDRFEHLSVFVMGERIAPVTMATVWQEAIWRAEEHLGELSDCSLLSQCGYRGGRKLFALHDLVHDLLRGIVPDGKRKEMTRHLVRAYSDRLDSVDPDDVFFKLRFVGLCLWIGCEEDAARCLCRLSYLLSRIRTQTANGLISDFSMTCDRLPEDERLTAFRRLVTAWLAVAVKREEPNLLLRAAVARHHEPAFAEAKEMMMAAERGEIFLEMSCPREGEPRDRTGVCDPVTGCVGRPGIANSDRLLSLKWDKRINDVVAVKNIGGRLGAECLLKRQTVLNNNLILDFLLATTSDDGVKIAAVVARFVVDLRLGPRNSLQVFRTTEMLKNAVRDSPLSYDMDILDVAFDENGVLYALYIKKDDNPIRTSYHQFYVSGVMNCTERIAVVGKGCPRQTRLWVSCEKIFIYNCDSRELHVSSGGRSISRFTNVQGVCFNDENHRMAIWRSSQFHFDEIFELQSGEVLRPRRWRPTIIWDEEVSPTESSVISEFHEPLTSMQQQGSVSETLPYRPYWPYRCTVLDILEPMEPESAITSEVEFHGSIPEYIWEQQSAIISTLPDEGRPTEQSGNVSDTSAPTIGLMMQRGHVTAPETGVSERTVPSETSVEDHDSSSSLLVLDLLSMKTIFQWRDPVMSVVFSSSGSVAFLTHNSLYLATASDYEQLHVSRSVDWSGDNSNPHWSEINKGLCRSTENLLFADDGVVFLQTDAGIVAVSLEDGRETLVWQWSFIDATWSNSRGRQRHVIDPHGTKLALSDDTGRIILLQRTTCTGQG